MSDVTFLAQRGHHCKVHGRWIDGGEEVPLPADEADRRVRHELGIVLAPDVAAVPPAEPAPEPNPLEGVNFASDEAGEAAASAQLTAEHFAGLVGTGDGGGFRKSDVVAIIEGVYKNPVPDDDDEEE